MQQNNKNTAKNKRRKIMDIWTEVSIKTKGAVWLAIFVTFSLLLASICFYRVDVTQNSAFEQINVYYDINNMLDDFDRADKNFTVYLKDPHLNAMYLETHYTQIGELKKQMNKTDFSVAAIGEKRNALSRALRNSFNEYINIRDDIVIEINKGNESTAVAMYYDKLTPVSEYITQYSRQLLRTALDEGQDYFTLQQKQNKTQYNVVVGVSIGILAIMGFFIIRLTVSILVPISKLSQAAKQISAGNYDVPDIDVKSRDELQRLTTAFNNMKHSVKNSFYTMHENTRITEQLHKKELEAAESNKLLQEAKMAQLRSQIKPHFLFNTLNIISRTARIEKAQNTEQLILALSRLFRYNLKTDDTEVSLQREINIINDYIKIQQTRFGSRIGMQWRISPSVDPETEIVPAFIFQPIVENAIIHGLEPKIDGGVIRIRIHRSEKYLFILISDNGVGMNSETVKKIINNTSAQNGQVSGIGVANVAERIKMLHQDSSFVIRSKPGLGTSICIKIP